MSAMASQITGVSVICPGRSFVPERRSKKASKLRVTGLCEGNSSVTGEFPAQRANNAKNISIRWRHHSYWYDTILASVEYRSNYEFTTDAPYLARGCLL